MEQDPNDEGFLFFPDLGIEQEEHLPPPDSEYLGEIGSSGIRQHYTLGIWDATKVQAFMDCPRGFFFSYVLGFRQIEPRVHLVFGSAWHEAMEHLIHHGYSTQAILEANQKFQTLWKGYYPDPAIYNGIHGKTPANAMSAIIEYCERWKRDQYEVLMTEVAGAVPINEEGTRMYHVKMDAVLREEDGVWAWEHKTTGQDKKSWYESWYIKMQVPGYTHGLNFIIPPDEMQGVKINGAILRTPKKNGDPNNMFVRLPIKFQPDMMAYWLWEVNYWIDTFEWNMEQLAECSPGDNIMYSFPRNGESCSKYGCKFGGLCSDWANPLRRCHDMPAGYHTEFWDPRKLVEEASTELRVDPKTRKATILQREHKPGIIRTIHD